MTDHKAVADAIDSLIRDLHSLKSLLLGPEAESPADAIDKAANGICLVCGRPLAEMKTRPTRGAHAHCYKQVMNAIKSGKTTENEAIRQGLILKEKAGGRPAILDIESTILSRRETNQTAKEESKERVDDALKVAKEAVKRRREKKSD